VPIPGGSVAGPAAVGAFCTVVGRGSSAFVGFVASPVKVLAGLTLAGLLLGFLLRRTSWRRVDPLPAVTRRRAGEIVRASMALYRHRFAAVAPLGLVAAPIALAAAVAGAALQHLPLFRNLATISATGGIGSRVPASSFAASVSWPLTAVVVTAPVARLLAPAADHRPQRAAPSAGVWARVGDLASSVLLAVIVVGALSLTVVGLPVAVFLAVRYLFVPQVAMLRTWAAAAPWYAAAHWYAAGAGIPRWSRCWSLPRWRSWHLRWACCC
jgi:hypothetical protein